MYGMNRQHLSLWSGLKRDFSSAQKLLVIILLKPLEEPTSDLRLPRTTKKREKLIFSLPRLDPNEVEGAFVKDLMSRRGQSHYLVEHYIERLPQRYGQRVELQTLASPSTQSCIIFPIFIYKFVFIYVILAIQ